MFRTTVLATTALVLCVSFARAGHQTGRPSDRLAQYFERDRSPVMILNAFPVPSSSYENGKLAPKYPNAIFDNIDWKDKNQEWLSWYGFRTEASEFCSYLSSQYHVCLSVTVNDALAFDGTGKKARKIGVPLYELTGSGTEFNVGIYSATPSGLPGNELAGGSTTASSTTICCTQLRWVDVNVKLKAGREYFLEVECGENGSNFCNGVWMPESEGTDYFHYVERETYNTYYSNGTQHYTYSSPWHASTYALGEGAAIIK